jgi:riboflavin kinase / FMN adenylyltransferase
MFKVIRDIAANALMPTSPQLALAIGNFDGVHVGHLAILKATVDAARAQGLVPAVMTFEPHPREFFSPQQAPARLSSAAEKIARLRTAGIEYVYIARFNATFAAQSVDAFITQLAVMKVKWLMVGEDFRFGFKRAGGINELRAANFMQCAAMPEVTVDGLRASSTLIRESLAEGDLLKAQKLLSYHYEITGHVVHGDKLGRTLNFPTANVALGPQRRIKPPLWGVYAVELIWHSSDKNPVVLQGAASLGRNPAVKQNGPPSLEVHIFNFAQSIYGEKVTVRFLKKLRDEANYPSLDALKKAIQQDCESTREFFSTREPA